MLKSFTGVSQIGDIERLFVSFFFPLISPGGISFFRLDWAAQMRAGKTSKAAEI